jgi:hypothetical protein
MMPVRPAARTSPKVILVGRGASNRQSPSRGLAMIPGTGLCATFVRFAEIEPCANGKTRKPPVRASQSQGCVQQLSELLDALLSAGQLPVLLHRPRYINPRATRLEWCCSRRLVISSRSAEARCFTVSLVKSLCRRPRSIRMAANIVVKTQNALVIQISKPHELSSNTRLLGIA